LSQTSQGLEASLEDQLEIEYSPTYWLHNNTVVPTTTQRTTTSTSTQSVHKSIFSTSMSSNAIEKITEKYKHDENDNDEDDDEEEGKSNDASALQTVSFSCLLILSLMKVSF
jgi:hypothetical protein